MLHHQRQRVARATSVDLGGERLAVALTRNGAIADTRRRTDVVGLTGNRDAGDTNLTTNLIDVHRNPLVRAAGIHDDGRVILPQLHAVAWQLTRDLSRPLTGLTAHKSRYRD